MQCKRSAFCFSAFADQRLSCARITGWIGFRIGHSRRPILDGSGFLWGKPGAALCGFGRELTRFSQGPLSGYAILAQHIHCPFAERFAIRRFSEASSMGRRLSSRFVAGMHTSDALRAAAELNSHGISVTLDSLGENVHSPEEAHRSAAIYHELLDAIHERHLDANVSVKLTQMGMDLDPRLAEEIVRDMTDHARTTGSFVRVDMEGSEYTQATIDMVRRIHAEPGNQGHVGIVIQAYLYRSQADIGVLLKDGIRIRLCKGAYQEPADKAFPAKAQVDENFVTAGGDPDGQRDLSRHRDAR